MRVPEWVARWRSWFPVPGEHGGVDPIRWLLLDGNRYAVTAALLSIVFAAIMLIGTLWTFEMQRLLTETPAVQTILTALLSGIILLVSIVVSINSIVLSHDMTSIRTQEDRIESVLTYRREIGRLTDQGERPSDPASFLELMGEALYDRADALTEIAAEIDEEIGRDFEEYADAIKRTADRLNEPARDATGSEFGMLWRGLEVNYGTLLDRSRFLRSSHRDQLSEALDERLDDLAHSFQLFVTGKEYFKTLYYTRETSQLSRVLLAVSLPAILITASTVLAINAGLLPDFWLFGLPPLLTFVAATFTISLAPYIVLTAFMLRLATVARRTSGAGPFTLES